MVNLLASYHLLNLVINVEETVNSPGIAPSNLSEDSGWTKSSQKQQWARVGSDPLQMKQDSSTENYFLLYFLNLTPYF